MLTYRELILNGTTASKIIIGDISSELQAHLPSGSRVIVITDANLHRLHGRLFDGYEHIIVGLGETSKTLATVEKVYSELMELKADRSVFLLGFGGGIVTDITGFVASTYMRGVRFGFVATSLLAQVDGSIGGKNGVNMHGYKNMIGTIAQPDFVICDASILKTLPEREFRSGFAEIIKAAIISDDDLFDLLERNSFDDFRNNPELLKEAILMAVNVKLDIVSRDEKENGERRKLNLGHTFGHAIEKVYPDYVHGEAVAAGLYMASEIAMKAGLLDGAGRERIGNIMEKYGFRPYGGLDRKKILKALIHDKKMESREINLILPLSVGECRIVTMDMEKLGQLFLASE